MFQGFTQAASDFLWELQFNNERPWFQAHKAEFEAQVQFPLKALGEELRQGMQESFPAWNWTVHCSRIYRDARRLFGRGPFKDHLWISLQPDDLWKRGPMFWFELKAAEFGFGLGFWAAPPETMDRFRRGIAANPARFERLALEVEALGRFTVSGPEYKHPKGDLGPVINRWYNRKYIGVEHMADFDPAALGPELSRELLADFRALMPLYEYLLELYYAAGDFAEEF